ncbi:hypothetical protein NBRC116493_06470 [Aurantivibrio infirmus]
MGKPKLKTSFEAISIKLVSIDWYFLSKMPSSTSRNIGAVMPSAKLSVSKKDVCMWVLSEVYERG